MLCNARVAIFDARVTVGNFPLQHINTDAAKQLITYMPDVGGTKAQKDQPQYRMHKSRIYHQVFGTIMETIKVELQQFNIFTRA